MGVPRRSGRFPRGVRPGRSAGPAGDDALRQQAQGAAARVEPGLRGELDCEGVGALAHVGVGARGRCWTPGGAGTRRSRGTRREGEQALGTLSLATRPTDPQVRAEATLVRMLASRIAEDTALVAELGPSWRPRWGRRDVPVPAHGAGVGRRPARALRRHLRLRGPRPPRKLLRPGAQNRQSGTSLNSVSSSRRQQAAQEPAHIQLLCLGAARATTGSTTSAAATGACPTRRDEGRGAQAPQGDIRGHAGRQALRRLTQVQGAATRRPSRRRARFGMSGRHAICCVLRG